MTWLFVADVLREPQVDGLVRHRSRFITLTRAEFSQRVQAHRTKSRGCEQAPDGQCQQCLTPARSRTILSLSPQLLRHDQDLCCR